ncbi:MAG: hypothetical protein HC893_05770 [Chloroflexaceae bacterium]|nr:hypothetical protein [Chloroflexaceae bacterium]NJL33438.1 hypothetical protein [Chloroflexaceae bacterium]NJO06182.1 hypothetical protein [Chloroflexaceae bacterium]
MTVRRTPSDKTTIRFVNRFLMVLAIATMFVIVLVACGDTTGTVQEEPEVAVDDTTVGEELGEAGEDLSEAGQDLEQGAEAAGANIEQGAEVVGEELAEGAAVVETELDQLGTEIQEVELAPVLDNPIDYEVGEISIAGEVIEQVGPNSFIIFDESLLDTDRSILVIYDSATTTLDLQPGDNVQVNGIVRTLDQNEFTNYSDVDPEQEVYDLFGGQPVIIATSLQDAGLVEEEQDDIGEEIQEGAAYVAREAGQGAAVIGQELAELGNEIQEIEIAPVLDNPFDFEVGEVSIYGEVGEMVGPNSFTLIDESLDTTDREILVVYDSATLTDLTLEPGNNLLVNGIVRTLDEEEFSTYSTVEPNAEAYDLFGGTPVIIATAIDDQ